MCKGKKHHSFQLKGQLQTKVMKLCATNKLCQEIILTSNRTWEHLSIQPSLNVSAGTAITRHFSIPRPTKTIKTTKQLCLFIYLISLLLTHLNTRWCQGAKHKDLQLIVQLLQPYLTLCCGGTSCPQGKAQEGRTNCPKTRGQECTLEERGHRLA